jgi:phage repressor protein C with HTH and peptisase S24 domain
MAAIFAIFASKSQALFAILAILPLCDPRKELRMKSMQAEQRDWLAGKLADAPRGTKVALAKHLGIRPDAVSRIVGDKEPRDINLDELARMADFFKEDPPGFTLKPIAPPVSRTIRPGGPEASEVEKVGEGWPDTGEEWMDVRGVTVGGDDSFFYFGDVIDQVRRPPGIRNAKNVAALNVAGESMVPRFAPGELIYVQHRAPAPGDDVVVELYPENDGDPPKSFLKRLVRKTGPRLYCRQFNPASDLEFDNGEVKILWRVLTLRDLLG